MHASLPIPKHEERNHIGWHVGGQQPRCPPQAHQQELDREGEDDGEAAHVVSEHLLLSDAPVTVHNADVLRREL